MRIFKSKNCSFLDLKIEPSFILFLLGRIISEANICILPNGEILKKAIRKEYRTLTDQERQKYHAALLKLMERGVFDEIAAIHVDGAQGGNVHGRPKFWSWHRKYLKK